MILPKPIRFIDWLPEVEEYFPRHGGDAPTQAQLDTWMGSENDVRWAKRLQMSPRLVHAFRMLGYVYCRTHGWTSEIYSRSTARCKRCNNQRMRKP